MAHEVENMMYVGETPWHGLGVKLNAPPTTREAIVAAGLDWTVNLVPTFLADGREIPGTNAVVRSTDSAIFGTVGDAYTPLQNVEAFSFFDPFLAAGEATLETAASLRGGRRIFVLAKLNRAPSVIVKGDEVEKYILLANSHDGTLCARVGFTPIRVVCQNTLSLAIRDSASKLVRLRHQKNIGESLDAVRDAMNTANAAFEATAEQFRKLAATSIVDADLKRYVREVFAPKAQIATPKPGATDAAIVQMMAEIATDTEDESKSRLYEPIKRLFETGRGNDMPGVRGTLWGAYNAVTEYLGYERGSSQDTRVDHLFFHAGAKLNQRALDVAIRMAA